MAVRGHCSDSILLFLTVALLLMTVFRRTDGEEYCLPEVFHAECASSEMIVVDKALFGRMELGRCVTRNYGHVGCAVDVLPAVDQACSGRRSCDLSVSDPALVRTKPCPKDFASYLDADYSCVPVLLIDPKICQETGLLVVNQVEGYISGTDLTLAKCVLAFKMAPDQRLNLTLLDFAASSAITLNGTASGGENQLHSDSSSLCSVQYATVTELSATGPSSSSSSSSTEPSGGYSAVICSGPDRRRHIMTSRSSHVQMRVIPSRDARFLIKFEVLGCGEPSLPANTHIHRDRAGLTVICNASRETFRLVCVGRKWTGTLHNCSKTVLPRRSDVESSEEYSLLPPFGVSVVIAVGIALVIVVYATLLVVCVLFMRKRYRQRTVHRETEEIDFNPAHTRLYGHSGICDVTMALADRHPVSFTTGTATCQCGQRSATAVASKPDVAETDCRQQNTDCGWPFYGVVVSGSSMTGNQTTAGRFRQSSKCDDVNEFGTSDHRRCGNDVYTGVYRTTAAAQTVGSSCNILRATTEDGGWLSENNDDVIVQDSVASIGLA